MTRRKNTPEKRGRKLADPEDGAASGATRAAGHRARMARHESAIAGSWARLAASAAIAGGDLLDLVNREIEALRVSDSLKILRSRLDDDSRDRLDAIGDIASRPPPEAGLLPKDGVDGE